MSDTMTATSNGQDRAALDRAAAVHRRSEVIEELADQADLLRGTIGQLYGGTDALADPMRRDDLAHSLSSVLQVINDTVRQLRADARTISLDDRA